MATRLQLRDRAKNYLDDLVSIYSDGQLDLWLDEGLRRMAPVVLQEKTTTIGPSGSVATLPTDCVYVMRTYDQAGQVEVGGWREHAGSLYLESSPGPITMELEYLGEWDAMAAPDASVCPLAEYQTDAIVFYTVARAFRQLAINRSDYRRYSTVVNNRVDLAELQDLAISWEQEFEKARSEARTRRQIMYEAQRQGGTTPKGE